MIEKVGFKFHTSGCATLIASLITLPCLLGCLPDKSPYEKYLKLKKQQAREACKEITKIGYPAVPFLIKALTNEKPYIGYRGSSSPKIVMTTLDYPSLQSKSLSRDCIYRLKDEQYLTVCRCFQIFTSKSFKDFGQMLLLSEPKDVLVLKVTEEPNVSRVANFLLSKITDTIIPWPGNAVSAQKDWENAWIQCKNEDPTIKEEVPASQIEDIKNAINKLEYDGPNHDPCTQMFCRLLLENGEQSVRNILKWASRDMDFYGMYKVETYARTVSNRSLAEDFLKSWHISKEEYKEYMFELESGKFLLIYTEMDLFEDIPNSSMITVFKEGIGKPPSTLHAANILLRMITGDSVEWETNPRDSRLMVKKWKEALKEL